MSHMESHVTDQRASGRGHLYLAAGSAGGYRGYDLRLRYDLKLCWRPMKSNPACSRQIRS